jgi:hypothetical protein
MIITTQPKPKQCYIYPWLGINEHNCIVLFYADSIGTVLRSAGEDSPLGVGYHSALWNMDNFQPFNGTVTLEN